MEVGILENDHLLDVLSAPQLYLFEIWIETIHLDRNKIKAPESVKSEINKAKSATTVKSGESGETETDEDYRRPEKRLIGRDDFFLPNGLKPLRVRYNLFDLKEVSILPVEFDILLLIQNLLQSSSEVSPSDSVNESRSEVNEDQTENETLKTVKDNDNSNRNYSKPAPSQNKSGNRKAEAASSGKTTSHNTDEKSGNQVSDDMSELSVESSNQNLFHLNEVLELLNEDIFIPKRETQMRRGGNATFAMAPLNMIQSLQRGKMLLTVDRFGGRHDDEGDFIGVATVTIPQTWIESVLKVANQPNSAPITFKVNDNIPIEDKTGAEVGRIEFMMKFHCLAGCVISTTMATQLSLYISIIDSSNDKPCCHKPVVRNKIYQSMMKKSLNDDYEILYKPSITESLRPCY